MVTLLEYLSQPEFSLANTVVIVLVVGMVVKSVLSLYRVQFVRVSIGRSDAEFCTDSRSIAYTTRTTTQLLHRPHLE